MIRSLVACAWDVESHVVKLSDGNDLPYEPKTRPNADEEVVYMGQTKSDVCVPPPPQCFNAAQCTAWKMISDWFLGVIDGEQ